MRAVLVAVAALAIVLPPVLAAPVANAAASAGVPADAVLADAAPHAASLRHDAARVTRVTVEAELDRQSVTAVATRRALTRQPAPPANPRPGVPWPRLVLGPDEAAGDARLASEPMAAFGSNGFPGMDDTVNGFVSGCPGAPRPCIEPPDPWIAVGPDHVVQAVNVAIRITSRTGAGATTIPLSTFFAEPPGQILNADPRVVYDAAKGRWLATEISYDCSDGRLYLAVSDGADPTGTWTVWEFVFGGYVPDYPGLGTAADKVLLGVNVYAIQASASPPGCTVADIPVGASLLVVDWADILDGADLSGIEFGPDPTLFTWRPAGVQGADATAHAVVEDRSFGFRDLGLAKLIGTVAGGDLAILEFRNLSDEGLAADFATPPPPVQPGSPGTISAATDGRPTDAVWRDGRLWLTSTHPCLIEAVHDCIRLVQLNTEGMGHPFPVVQDVVLGWAGFDSFHAGVGLSADGTMFAVYSRSSASSPVGVQVVHQRLLDTEFRGWHQLIGGTGTYQGTRWGDYVGVATDPTVPYAVWQGHEYANAAGGWSTWVSQLTTTAIGTPGVVTRLSGADRYATAAAISAGTFASGVPVAYVATGANYPDALSGSAAAAFTNGPLLLVRPDSIPPLIAAELTRLQPARIVVLGGPSVLSEAVKNALGGYTTGTVTRLSGADRYATAAAISAATFSPGVSTAFIAVGSNFPDALSGGPAAGLEDSPLLLVTRDTIPPATAAELTRLKPAQIAILGGPSVVSSAVESALGAYAVTGAAGVARHAGADRYATASTLSAAAFPTNVSTVYIATGANYPDALAGGAAAAYEDSPLLLVTGTAIPPTTAAELVRLSPARIVILGGPSVVSSAVEASLAAYLAP